MAEVIENTCQVYPIQDRMAIALLFESRACELIVHEQAEFRFEFFFVSR